ncbi:hypothetical protein F4808DRAFT_418841 [Astrocystis sublimbata]|nr:hypothetical protein F4808DRAFT_418841 [Astrocystis sublimbata]
MSAISRFNPLHRPSSKMSDNVSILSRLNNLNPLHRPSSKASSKNSLIVDMDMRAFMTCTACRRSLRAAMFVNLRTQELTKVCRCCRYQDTLIETSGPKNPNWWQVTVRTYSKAS